MGRTVGSWLLKLTVLHAIKRPFPVRGCGQEAAPLEGVVPVVGGPVQAEPPQRALGGG